MAYNHLRNALLMGHLRFFWDWLDSGSSMLYVALILAKEWGGAGGTKGPHTHIESLCWNMARATSGHIHLVKIRLMAKMKVMKHRNIRDS